jgi:hypothetical protein
MTDLTPLAGALATMVAAIIAGTITFISTVLSKEQKTSEFRQNWIDALRNDIAEFVGETDVFFGYALASKHRGKPTVDFIDESNDAVRKAAAAYYRICLRLNPDEHQTLLDALQRAFLLYSGKGELTVAGVDETLEKVVSISQRVLKTEWKRVKRGESPYFITKYTALGIASIALAAAAYWLTRRP